MNQKNICGYTVFYEDNAAKGIEHLAYVLSFDEGESLFRSARDLGKATFEDRYGRNFNLVCKSDASFEVQPSGEAWV